MKPLKAQPYVERKLTLPCFVQPKLNGVRALYQRGRFYSGDEHEWHPDTLAHLSTFLLDTLGDSSAVLDGELYFHGWSLQRINSAVAVKRTKPTHETPSIQFHVFDAVDLELSFAERYLALRRLLPTAGSVSLVPTFYINTILEADQLYERFVAEGYEGAMYRMGDNQYTTPSNGSTKDNRVQSMLKRKAWKDADFRVVGVEEGEPGVGSKYVGTLGAFTLVTATGIRFNAAPAFTDAERHEYWLEPPLGKLAIVRYLNLSDEGIPLHPRVLAIREA